VVAALRVHVVSGRNWCLVFPVWFLGMVPVGTNIWGATRETFSILPQLGCMSIMSLPGATYSTYVDFADSVGFYALTELCRMVIISRTSVVVSDILVVGATWYYISYTSSVRTQLVREVWGARPNLTTVMFRDDLLIDTVALSDATGALDITHLTTASVKLHAPWFGMSSILISRFLVCIREAAERSTQVSSSQSLSFTDSQGDSNLQSWLSTIEFAADIANPSAGDDSHADAFSDLEDDLDPRDQDDASEGDDGTELEEYTVSVRSVDAHTP
ncbi:hypothetical protein POSPLADRAFT_1128868, partial [Postia placenta MAD-698-R-SB12]